MFNDSDKEYQIEPGTQDDIEVLQLLKIPGYGAGAKGEEEIQTDINEEIGALADKEAMDSLVDELKSQNQQFVIDIGNETKIFEFRMNDPIFTIGGIQYPTQATIDQQKACGCCGETFKNAKEVKQCHFCALSYCSKCRYKTRPYPKNQNQKMKRAGTLTSKKEAKKEKDNEERGEICKVCDRKFFIKEIVEDKNLQIEAQTNQLLGPQGLNSQMEKSNTQLKEIREEYDKERKLYALDYQKIQLVKDEKRQRLRKVKKKNEDVEMKNLEQMDRQEAKRKEIIELDGEINLYQDEMAQMTDEL